MELNDFLRQFKTIEPDAGYTERSRRVILNTTPRFNAPARRGGIWQIAMGTLQTGLAIVLTSILFLVVAGKLSNIPFVSKPLSPTGFDLQTLKAEAEAVDIQVRLAEITYQALETQKTSESTEATAERALAEETTAQQPLAEQQRPNSEEPTTETPSIISTDEALQKLLE